MRILGIDPGFAITGYGVIEYENSKFKVLDYGVIKTKAGSDFEKRLLLLSEGIEMLIKEYKPDESAVEDLFFNKNVKTAIKAAQGRGAALLTCAKCNLEIFEYTPLQVKQAVTGYGRADKNQVQQMVKSMLSLNRIPKPDDAADALACAICHAHSASVLRKYRKGI